MIKLILLLLSSTISLALAASTIEEVISKKPIRFYSSPEDAVLVREVSPDEFAKALPMPVLSEEGERVKIDYDKQNFWVPSMSFKISRECKEKGRVITRKTEEVSMVRGVGEKGGCK